MKKFVAPLFCATLAVAFMALHLFWGWHAFQEEALEHGQVASATSYLVQWGRDTTENMQSEFWQLAMQFLVLAGVLKAVGVQAHEEDQEQVKEALARIERKVDRA